MHWGKVEGRKQLPSTAFLFLQKAHGEEKDGQWPKIRTTGAPELRTTNDQTQICRIVNNFHVLKHGLNQYLLRHKKNFIVWNKLLSAKKEKREISL